MIREPALSIPEPKLGGSATTRPDPAPETPLEQRLRIAREATALEAAGADWEMRHVMAVLGMGRTTAYAPRGSCGSRAGWASARSVGIRARCGTPRRSCRARWAVLRA